MDIKGVFTEMKQELYTLRAENHQLRQRIADLEECATVS